MELTPEKFVSWRTDSGKAYSLVVAGLESGAISLTRDGADGTLTLDTTGVDQVEITNIEVTKTEEE